MTPTSIFILLLLGELTWSSLDKASAIYHPARPLDSLVGPDASHHINYYSI